jgi:hypothetical protein
VSILQAICDMDLGDYLSARLRQRSLITIAQIY